MSVTNIFLFRDISKVKIGIGSPAGVTNPTDGQSVTEGSLTYVYDTSTASWNITTQTNQIFVSGLTTDPSTVTFSSGKIIKNGVDSGTSVSVSDGDIVRLSVTNPTLNSTNNYTFDVDGTTLEFNVELNDPQTANYDVEITRTLTFADEPEREVQDTIINVANQVVQDAQKTTNISDNISKDFSAKTISAATSQLYSNVAKRINTFEEDVTEVKEILQKFVAENVGNLVIAPDLSELEFTSEKITELTRRSKYITDDDMVSLRQFVLAYLQDTELKTLVYSAPEETTDDTDVEVTEEALLPKF